MKNQKNYEERIESAKSIIQENIQTIYHMPAGYPYLSKALSHAGIRKTLLVVLNFIKDKDIFIYKRKYCFFLDNTKLTELRKTTTYSVSSRYINYLCCLGVINKQYQFPEPGKISNINLGFMLDTRKKRPVNTFYIRRYTVSELQRLEARAKKMAKNKITPGNISYNKLAANGCEDLAKEVFFANNPKSIEKKKDELQILLSCMDNLCAASGYTTKKELQKAIRLSDQEVEKLFRIFKSQIWQIFNYKAPSKQDMERYGLKNKKWIITKRENK